MLLPHQSPPVERGVRSQGALESQPIQPQGPCVCRTVNGRSTWWCLIGKDLVNTGQPCKP